MDRTRGQIVAASVLATLMTMLVASASAAQQAEGTQQLELHAAGGIAETGDGQLSEHLADSDGQPVGTAYWDCTMAEGVAWFCDAILALEDGDHTDAGTLVVQGLFDGFNGESLAITGGTGAYADARGSVRLFVKDEAFTWALDLIL